MRGDGLAVPHVVLAGLTLAVVVGVAVAGATSSASYGPYNDEWDGTTDLRSMADDTGTRVELAHDTATYSSVPADDAVAFVLSPDQRYRPTELARVTDFVERGGTLVVADDYGPHSNDLLRSVGTSARLDGRPLYDVRSNYRSSAMPVATPVDGHPFVAGVESVTLNYGTAVDPGDATPLVETSEHAYLDADRDGEFGQNETLDNRTVATVESVGDGRVVVVGDSSAFINAMLDRPGNRAFVRALVAQHGTVVLDHSHTGSLPPLALAVLVVRGSTLAQFGLGLLAVGALAAWARRAVGTRREPTALADDARLPRSELAESLERRHPDWDRERIERVVSAVERRRER